MRTVVALLIAAALVLGVVFFWFAAPDDTPGSTAAAPSTSTTTITSSSQPSPTSSAAAPTSTSTAPTSHIVETVEEAEAILRDLWFGWFEGIYQQDEDRIREVVASEAFLNAGSDAFGQLDFVAPPTALGISFLELEILQATEDCLAVWSTTKADFLNVDSPRSGVEVLRLFEGNWRFMSAWQLRDDLWEEDCGALLQPLS